MVIGLTKIKFSKGFYQGCILGKHPKHKYVRINHEWTYALIEIIHNEMCFPFPHILSTIQSKYVITLIDNFSIYCWFYFLKQKSEFFYLFKVFKDLVENEFGRKLKILRYDNGGEYFKSDLIQYCEYAGFHMHHSIPYTPQQNGVVERKNRSLKEMSTCMMESKHFPPDVWEEDIKYESYM